jgi:hypothetical protein
MLTADRHRTIEKVLARVLEPRAADIIRRRFGLGGYDEQTLDEIGASWGLTRERIRQLAVKALERLASDEAARPLYEYLIDETRRSKAQPPGGWAVPDKKSKKKSARASSVLRSSPTM